MELKEFLKEYLTGYDVKIIHIDLHGDEEDIELESDNAFAVLFAKKYFPEALQNFADRICQEQCRLCAEEYQNNVSYEYHQNHLYNRILECEYPKIEDL